MSNNTNIRDVSWHSFYSSIQKLFLDRYENNISDLLGDIESILNYLPKSDVNAPYIGDLEGNYSFLNEFEELPDEPLGKEHILKSIAKVFSGTLKWHHPQVMHNINPPPMISSVAAASVANLYNLNPIWDFVSAGTQELEQQIVRQIASLAGWNNHVDGVFTFGGKGCLTYAIRIGLNRCIENASLKGISHLQKQPLVITSEANHYSIDTICSLIGIGYENCWRTSVQTDETMNLVSFEAMLDKALSMGHPIAAIIVSGGNTLHLSIDNLFVVRQLVDCYIEKYQLNYRPYIYFDTVVGWPWMFFRNYDFTVNSLELNETIKPIIEEAVHKISMIHLADGFGIDFHKSGLCPYLTSLFMTKNAEELHSIHKAKKVSYERKPHGGNFLQHHTIEHSRSAAPIVSAWVVLQTMGRKGFQSYIANSISIAYEIRKDLPNYGFELVNPYSLGFASVFCPIFTGSNYTYDKLLIEKEDVIDDYNKYTFQLFQFLLDKQRNGYSSFIFRFLPQFRIASCGKNVSVLVLYPMSIDNNILTTKEISYKVGQVKSKFDLIFNKEEVISELIPKHVPK